MNQSQKLDFVEPESANSFKDVGYDSVESLYLVLVILSIFAVTGTIGNALVLYVFSNLKQKMTSTIFILALAGMDFITCLVSIPYTMLMECLGYKVKFEAVCKIYHFLITTTVPFSAFIMVAIAIDRYLCICHPFLRAMTIKRAQILVGFLSAFALTLGIIGSLAYGVSRKKSVFVHSYNISTLEASTTSYETIFPDQRNFSQYFTRFNYSLGSSSNLNTLSTPLEGNLSLEYIQKVQRIKYVCTCLRNDIILGAKEFEIYQKCYSALFLVSLVIVALLYALIYRSVLARRKQRLKIVTNKCCLFWSDSGMPEETEITSVPVNETSMIGKSNIEMGEKAERDAILKHGARSKLEKVRMANLKTAGMLFVVTVVFVLAFLPAWLMAHQLIPMNIVVFYMYFFYNVANPVIYAFMNRVFRNQLKEITNCRK